MTFETELYENQYHFQAKFMHGRTLNVGANDDSIGCRYRPGSFNVDYHRWDEHTKKDLPVHVQADARALPFKSESFDSVVLGEILEHCEEKPAITILSEAKRMLRKTGRSTVIVTMPHDARRDVPGNAEPEGKMYAKDGIYAYHYRLIKRDELLEWIKSAGLEPLLAGIVSYVWGFDYETGLPGCKGTGLICKEAA